MDRYDVTGCFANAGERRDYWRATIKTLNPILIAQAVMLLARNAWANR